MVTSLVVTTGTPRQAGGRLVADAGGVLLAWLALLALENLVVGIGWRALLSGSWEMGMARKFASPIALGALAPLAFVAVGLGRLAHEEAGRRAHRAALTALAAVAGGLVGLGVTHGRHFADVWVRVPFVGAVSVAAAAAAWGGAPLVVRWLARSRSNAWLGALAAAAFWSMDALVLPRLYPAFHDALLALTLGSAALVSRAWRGERRPALAGTVLLVFALACIAVSPPAARRLRSADNLRLVLVEHAPLLGRAVRLAALLAPPEPDEASPTLTSAPGEIPRALDWSGRDVLLVSVDALRADHASAYGYERPTTPSLSTLAAEGALFEAAYCPTPHTSYSVTSMMTGKALHPLFALGLGKGSETWAAALRRYGYRTAAFYPPAVFFIDEDRFHDFEGSGLDFEYRKVEFAPARLRVEQVRAYLEQAAPDRPLFLWVHLFEPHEPYEMHPDHPFGEGRPVDAYDSEIAEADEAVGRIVALVRQKRPGAVVIVTADHGEEFGEHGGRYHGTSVYEEQVHVPLVVVGPGVAHRRVPTVVQSIDLLPTTLSALGIPRPARVRGRDLGPLLAGKPPRRPSEAPDPGVAYAETDEYALLAQGDDRLVCARQIGACTLYDVARDPAEQHDRSGAAPDRARAMRAELTALERSQGQFEGQGGGWPEPLRRGLQGDADAALDVATLLDDANVAIRRKAAEVLFRLRAPAVVPEVRRGFERDEDAAVRSWCAIALVRMGEGEREPAARKLAESLVAGTDLALRRWSALAFAEQGDGRGAAELAAWWQAEAPPAVGLDVEDGKQVLAAMARVRDAAAVPALLRTFDFVPLRPWIADALGAIGDGRARTPLLEAFAEERYVTARPREARALVSLGVRAELLAPLARFAGVPEPMEEALAIARDAHLLRPSSGGIAFDSPVPELRATLRAPAGPLRLLALAASPGGALAGTVAGRPLEREAAVGSLHYVDLPDALPREVALQLTEPSGLLAAWIVARAAELPVVHPGPDAGPGSNPGPGDEGGRPATAE